jgi:hypothetical protein
MTLHDTRSNTAPEGCTPAPKDSQPPPPQTGCGERDMRARGFFAVDRGKRGSTALRVDVGLLAFRSRELLTSYSDPFSARFADAYPRCLMPDGQQWVSPLTECSTTALRPSLRKPRLFSGVRKIALTETTEGRGALTDAIGDPVRANGPHVTFRCGDAAASSYTLTFHILLTRAR